ncbi:MAG TPA: class I SAM-dependent methyltransferase [Desulfatiglandales bacterium]|nr:class I SAM-dependent methyltransferase [Desulfatiglandales bacterium]
MKGSSNLYFNVSTGIIINMDSEREKRWLQAQMKEDAFWKREGVLEPQMERVISRYRPVIERISQKLPPNAVILDVGCGPTCAARLFGSGLKIFMDPLMSSYQKKYSGILPEGQRVSCTAEGIPLRDNSSDIVLCVNALDHMIDPGRALGEIYRVLKRDGIFILGLFIHPPFIAVARRFIEHYLPLLREDAHPYSYTKKSARHILKNYFYIREEVPVYIKDSAWIPAMHREDRIFICGKGKV